MAGFISALIKQRNDAKKAGPDTSGRLKEIIDIIRKYDYDDGITPEIVVGIIQDLGPTFVKIGQIASQQSEHIPPDYCDALCKLRSSVAPMDYETVQSQIEKYLGKPVEELFASFEEKPLGSASIGQVHKAELFDGTTVAVKVRRPGVVDTVARDFALIEKVLDIFVKDGVGGIDIKGLILELEKTSKIELDFTNEADNLDLFYANNADRAQVECPKCYRDYTNEAILTEDFVTGKEAGNIEYIETLSAEERDRLAALVADNFATQVLVDGFYHADPHSGNVLINEPVPVEPVDDELTEEEAALEEELSETDAELPEHSIEWIDFGMMGTLTPRQCQLLTNLISSMVKNDAYGLKRTVLTVAKPMGEIDHGALLELCQDMCDQCTGTDFGDFDLGDLLSTVLGNLQDENYKIDPFLTNLSRGIIAAEGTIKTLSPNVNILNYFLGKVDLGLNLDFDSLKDAAPEIAMKALAWLDGSSTISGKTVETLDMLEKGQIKVRTDLALEEKAFEAFNTITEYAVRAHLNVAIFIGSCLLCTVTFTGTTPFLIAFPVLGSAGIAVSLFFMFHLFADVRKANKK